MKDRCKPPRLDEHEWRQFDFTRWNLDSVARDKVAGAVAGLARQFFESPEWQESVQATVPQIQQAALGIFKEHAQKLRESRAATEKDFEERAASGKTRVDAMRRAMAASSSPQPPPASPDAYHLAVRVTGTDQALGFPGVLVEIADPRDPKAAPIASATTDVDGNVTLTVGPEFAKEIDKRDTTITAIGPSGKVLARLPDSVCVRLNQVETKVLTIKESGETTPLKEAALATRASREMLLESLTARTQSLAKDRKEKLANFDCKLQDVDALVAEIEKPVDLAELVARAKPYEPPPSSDGTPRGPDTPPRDNPPGGGRSPVDPGRMAGSTDAALPPEPPPAAARPRAIRTAPPTKARKKKK
jgi:hypothetical protein